jgi:hypothetical protein
MARVALFAALLLLAAVEIYCLPYGTDPTTLPQLGPQKLTVNATYNINGKNLNQAPVTVDKYNAPGIPILLGGTDKILISYAVKPAFTANTTGTVTLRVCWSKASAKDRPWRAITPNLAENKQCKNVVARGLNPSSGTYTYTLANTIGIGQMFVRAVVYCAPTGTNPPISHACAYGDSVGFFQVQKIDSTPAKIKISVGVLSCLGPLFLIGYFTYDKVLKKRR